MLELSAPRELTYGQTVALRGRIVPAAVEALVTVFRDGAPIGTATTGVDGAFVFPTQVEGPATYEARAGSLVSLPVAPPVRPRLRARLVGSRLVGGRLRLQAGVEPVGVAPLRLQIRRHGRLTVAREYQGAFRVRLATRRTASLRITVSVAPFGWAAAARTLRAAIVRPRLALGSRGPSVRELERRLRELSYALPGVDGSFGIETEQAVLAFQKVEGLAWTGRVDARVWRRLARAQVPHPRYHGTHLEVSKGRQVLFVVRNGRVALVVHVSTGASGNTPIGRWRIYRKVPGWDWILWYPMYFVRGFAIHGYPFVPAYAASHGCVRVPMWVAPRLYVSNPWGGTVYVYW